MSEEVERPRNANIVPNYESYVMLRVNEIAEAINHGNVISALNMLKTFYATLPDPIKTKLEEENLRIEVAIEVASQQQGITAYQTMRAQTQAYQKLGQIYVLPFLKNISHQLYLGGYYEKTWGPQTKTRNIEDIAKKLRGENPVS
jgi:hypothetical protein